MFCTSPYFYEKSEITYFSVKVQWKLLKDHSLINIYSKTFPNGVYYISRSTKYKGIIMIYKKGPSGKRIFMEVRDTNKDSVPDVVVETTVVGNDTESLNEQLWHTSSGKYNLFKAFLSHWTIIRLILWNFVRNFSPTAINLKQ